MTAFAYLLGVLAHVASKWLDWKRESRESAWMDYWTSEGLSHASAGIAALVCFGAWEFGWIALIMERGGELVAAALTAGQMQVDLPSFPVNGWTSLFAGYVMDSGARRVLDRIPILGGK